MPFPSPDFLLFHFHGLSPFFKSPPLWTHFSYFNYLTHGDDIPNQINYLKKKFDTPNANFGEGNGNPLQYSCLENPMDRGAWWAAVHGVTKSRTRLSDFTFTFHFHALEEEMATYSSVLAWRIPGTAEPGGLPGVAQSWT